MNYDDPQPRTNVRQTGDRITIPEGVRGKHYITRAGPGSTPYPAADSGATVYFIEWIENVSFPKIPGAQELSFDPTGLYGYVRQVVPNRYMELGHKGLAFENNGQWHTLD